MRILFLESAYILGGYHIRFSGYCPNKRVANVPHLSVTKMSEVNKNIADERDCMHVSEIMEVMDGLENAISVLASSLDRPGIGLVPHM